MREKVWIFLLCACVLVSTAACGKTASKTEKPLSLTQTETEKETVFSFAAQLAGAYRSHIAMSETMGVDLYLRISEDGSFVFARDTQFLTQEKGAGTVTENAFEYTLVNGEAVDSGTRTSSYTVDPDGSIRFTSPMWFGSTEPKITAEDGSVSYPVFEPFDTAEETSESETQAVETEADTPETKMRTTIPSTTAAATKPATTQKSAPRTTKAQTTTATTRTYGFTYASQKTSTTKAPATTTTTTTTKPTTTTTTTKTTTTTATTSGSGSGSGYTSPVVQTTTTTKPATTREEGFKEGVSYRGSMEKFVDAMNSTVHYDVAVIFRDGQYTGTVQVRLTGGMEHAETQSYSGTYTLNGNTLTMTGDFSKGSISGNSIELTGKLSSFASESDSVTVTR